MKKQRAEQQETGREKRMTNKELLTGTTEERAAIADEDIVKMSYFIQYYEAANPQEFSALQELAARLKELEGKKIKPAPRPAPQMVRCDCGHLVRAGQRMSASMGSSCPNCYDRMS